MNNRLSQAAVALPVLVAAAELSNQAIQQSNNTAAVQNLGDSLEARVDAVLAGNTTDSCTAEIRPDLGNVTLECHSADKPSMQITTDGVAAFFRNKADAKMGDVFCGGPPKVLCERRGESFLIDQEIMPALHYLVRTAAQALLAQQGGAMRRTGERR